LTKKLEVLFLMNFDEKYILRSIPKLFDDMIIEENDSLKNELSTFLVRISQRSKRIRTENNLIDILC